MAWFFGKWYVRAERKHLRCSHQSRCTMKNLPHHLSQTCRLEKAFCLITPPLMNSKEERKETPCSLRLWLIGLWWFACRMGLGKRRQYTHYHDPSTCCHPGSWREGQQYQHSKAASPCSVSPWRTAFGKTLLWLSLWSLWQTQGIELS